VLSRGRDKSRLTAFAITNREEGNMRVLLAKNESETRGKISDIEKKG
jgi:hypothetical protein